VVLQICKSHNHIDDAVIATGTGPITSKSVSLKRDGFSRYTRNLKRYGENAVVDVNSI